MLVYLRGTPTWRPENTITIRLFARFCMWDLIAVDTQRPFYLLNARSMFALFLCSWTHCVDGFSVLSQRYVRKENDAKNPATLGFFIFYRKNREHIQCSVFAVARKTETEWFCRNLPISNDPVVGISRKLVKNSLKPREWSMVKIWILTEEVYNKTGRFTANYENRLCHFFKQCWQKPDFM